MIKEKLLNEGTCITFSFYKLGKTRTGIFVGKKMRNNKEPTYLFFDTPSPLMSVIGLSIFAPQCTRTARVNSSACYGTIVLVLGIAVALFNRNLHDALSPKGGC